MQLRNKQAIWAAFTSPETAGLPPTQRQWVQGYRLVLMADTVLIYAEGHRAFKIDLSHAPTTVAELVSQAKMLQPGAPASAAMLQAYKEDRRTR